MYPPSLIDRSSGPDAQEHLRKSWSKRIKNRDKILQSRRDMTRDFTKAYEFLLTYQNNEAFRAVVAQFWAALFEAVTKLVWILLRTQPSANQTSKNFIKKTFNNIASNIPENESAAIDDILQDVNKARKDVLVCREMLSNA